MPSKILPNLEKIAITAKEYAQEYIKKSYTQLENNNLPEVYQLALFTGILDLRDEINHVIDFDSLSEYEKEIEIIKKYSLGNCREMARMALYYVLTHHPNVFAQLCYIEDGDHVFLIVGQNATKAFICDPWSNEVYPFLKWQDKLQNYISVEIDLSKETLELQENQLKELAEKGLHVEKKSFPESVLIFNQAGENLGQTYFFNSGRVRSIIPLKNEQFLIPSNNESSEALYNKGATFRRNKIKVVLDLAQPFNDILFSQMHILKQLLNEEHLLQDDCLQSALSNSELMLRKELIECAVINLKLLRTYINLIKDSNKLLCINSYFLGVSARKIAKLIEKTILFEKFYPIPEQLKKINQAIDCLNQLLEGRLACYVDNESLENSKMFNAEEYIFENLVICYKPILEFFTAFGNYQHSLDKKQEIEEVDQLINDLKNIIFNYFKSPTLIKSSSLLSTFYDVKETLDSFNLSSEDLLILSLNKLIELFSDFEKAPILRTRKMNNLSLSNNNMSNNVHTLFNQKINKDLLAIEKELYGSENFNTNTFRL